MNKYLELLKDECQRDIILLLILNVILIFTETISIALIPIFINYVVNPDLFFLISIEPLKNFVKGSNINNVIYSGVALLIFLFFIKNIITFIAVYYETYLEKKFNLIIKKKFLNLYLNVPYETINKYNSAEILRNTETESQNYVSNFLLIIKFFKDFILFWSIFLLLAYVDLFSTLVIIFFMACCIISYLIFFNKKVKKLGKVRVNAVSAIYQWINQSMGAIKDIKINKKENIVLKIFMDKVNIFQETKRKIAIIQFIPKILFELVFVTLILIIIAVLFTSEKNNVIPVISLYVFAFIRSLPIITRFGSNITSLRFFGASAILLNNEYKKNKIFISKTLDQQSISFDQKIIFNKKIALKNLCFQYSKNTKNVINDLNFEIQKSKAIAFVGKSGAGKTTLINLISGLLKPSSGHFSVDDSVIGENYQEWQKKIGLISQDNYLLDDTIKNNILFLEEKDDFSQNKLDKALFYSGLNEFIKTLHMGLETIVGERGTFLSGGQVQRIALARLLYRDPEVLILDEFTSSLDPEIEDQILEKLSLLKIEMQKTLIIISHKIKPLKICDEIFLLDQGKIVDTLDYKSFYDRYNILYE